MKLPLIRPSAGNRWRDKILAPNPKADALEGVKPDVRNDDWRERLLWHAERLNRYHPRDIELFRREKDGHIGVFRMREGMGYYYVDLCKPMQDGTLLRAGWGPLSPQNVIAAALPDHPEAAARVLDAASPERQDMLRHVLDDLLSDDPASIVTGAVRSWNDMLYICRESVVVHQSEDGIEVRINIEQNPTLRNPDPRKIHHTHWLTIAWTELSPRRESLCARIMHERNPLESDWWIAKLLSDSKFIALFRRPD